ncbi:MAG: AbrB/MazE/SpoVT family DNA-binding domain-containing protein [Thermoplasmata archaeon]
MASVVTIDRTGRIVIPKETRKAQRIQPGTKFLLVEGRDGRLWLQRLDPDELAKRLHEELKDVDLDPLIKKVKAEIAELAGQRYAAAVTGKR